jgi:predicted  nucleic acid-binding Zn-ribbon protein
MDNIGKRLKELSDTNDLKKLKDEYQRLGEEYLQGEEKLKKNEYQRQVKYNEIKNLEDNKKACEDIKFSRETDTVKKLEGIEKQLEKVLEREQELENNITSLANEADNIEKSMIETKKRRAFIKKKYLSCKEESEKAREELKIRQAELASSIGSMIETVDTESFEMYNRLIKAHADPISMVEKRKCTGCTMEVPSMDFEALKSGNQEMRCQSCGRLLYYIKP